MNPLFVLLAGAATLALALSGGKKEEEVVKSTPEPKAEKTEIHNHIHLGRNTPNENTDSIKPVSTSGNKKNNSGNSENGTLEETPNDDERKSVSGGVDAPVEPTPDQEKVVDLKTKSKGDV